MNENYTTARDTLLNGMYVIEMRALTVAGTYAKIVASGDTDAKPITDAYGALMDSIAHYEQDAAKYITGKYARRVVVDAVTNYAAWVAVHNDRSEEKRFKLIDLIYDAID